jgi:hypothetical protein
MNLNEIKDILPFLIPLIVIELGLLAICLVDLVRRERVTGGSKLVWGFVIVLINIIGPVTYLAFGRKEAYIERDSD